MKTKFLLFLAMMISKISKKLEDKKEIRLDFSMIKGICVIDFLLLIIFTIIYFTFFGCFLITYPSTVQTVALSSEGPAAEMYPESMGQYQLAEEVISRWVGKREWYQHRDREDRFLMYNDNGNNAFPALILTNILR